MAEQRMKVRHKKVQKMTKDGLVEENLTDKSSVRVSNRASDVQMGGKQGEKELSLVDKSSRQSERSGKNIRPSVQKSRDAPELIRTEKQSEDFGQNRKQQNRKRIRTEVGKESRLAGKSEAGQSGRLKEKRADLSENRGDSRRNQTGGSKKPKQKQRLKFAYEETGASVKNEKDMSLIFTNLVDTDMLFGHRNDAKGYGKAIEEIDTYVDDIVDAMQENDLLIITADHGCDPTVEGTDHTREKVPVLIYSKTSCGGDLGEILGFDYIAQTVEKHLGI